MYRFALRFPQRGRSRSLQITEEWVSGELAKSDARRRLRDGLNAFRQQLHAEEEDGETAKGPEDRKGDDAGT